MKVCNALWGGAEELGSMITWLVDNPPCFADTTHLNGEQHSDKACQEDGSKYALVQQELESNPCEPRVGAPPNVMLTVHSGHTGCCKYTPFDNCADVRARQLQATKRMPAPVRPRPGTTRLSHVYQ